MRTWYRALSLLLTALWSNPTLCMVYFRLCAAFTGSNRAQVKNRHASAAGLRPTTAMLSYALLEIWQRSFSFCFCFCGGEGRNKKLLMVWEDSSGSCRRPASLHSVCPASVWYRLQGNSPARASAAPLRRLSCGKLSASPEPLAASSSRHGYNIFCVVVM